VNNVSQRIADEAREALGSKVILVEPFEYHDPETDSYSPGIKVTIDSDADAELIEDILLKTLSTYVVEAGNNLMPIPTYDIVWKDF
jgi:hypothetical protein